eukprot:gene19158-25000_t
MSKLSNDYISSNQANQTNEKDNRFVCLFNNESIHIPGCHGNSVIKFEFFDLDRKVGSQTFSMNNKGGLMYWGGEYIEEIQILNHRRAAQLHNRIINRSSKIRHNINEVLPLLNFKIISGPPMKSRCQWCKLSIWGHGPIKRSLYKGIVSYFISPWIKSYLSLDHIGLHFFEYRYSTSSLCKVNLNEVKEIKLVLGDSTQSSRSNKIMSEDLYDVVLYTINYDEIHLRFIDSSSRVQWFESLNLAFGLTSNFNLSATYRPVTANTLSRRNLLVNQSNSNKSSLSNLLTQRSRKSIVLDHIRRQIQNIN